MYQNQRFRSKSDAFSLVELLVVIAIIGTLVSLVLPAVQSSREAARRVHCNNNLRQVGLALLGHTEARGDFPYGGWGHQWVGVPGRGSGRHQPGGWIYSTLPYLEKEALHDLGHDLENHANATDAHEAYTQRLETSLPMLTCPSRRQAGLWPIVSPHVSTPKPYGLPKLVARADYAMNAGASHILSFAGPDSLAEGDKVRFWNDATYVGDFTGISHLRIGIPPKAIEDGLSNTYLLGEKYLFIDDYETGRSPGDNESLYSGYCTDLHRFTGNMDADPKNRYLRPSQDHVSWIATPLPGFLRFGSAHPGGFNMTYCDGSVRWIHFDVDAEIHLRSGHRLDGGASLSARISQ